MNRKKYAKPCLKTYGDVADLTRQDAAEYSYRVSVSGGKRIKWRKIIRRRDLREAQP